MHIRKIKLSNIRGFREVDLDLTRPDGSLAGWTVLAGRNGSGKSTLLKAVALAVAGPEAARALYPSFADWMRAGQKAAKVTVSFDPFGKSNPLPTALLAWGRASESVEPHLVQPDEFPRAGWFLARAAGERRKKELFLTAYGPYRRLSGHAVDAQRLMDGPEPIARVVSLFREDASLIESVGWLREIYLWRLENKQGAAELEKAVLALLNDGLLPDGVRVDKVDSDGLWVFQRDVRLPLRELSDGYRTVAALVLDIVRHLHRTFGTLEIEQAADEEGSFWRVLHSGVVLIDEADNHLHVAWQQRIGFWLKRHFPSFQFIVTTHSPFICQAADPGGLIRLPAPGEERSVEHVSDSLFKTVVHGSLDEAVLTDLFGLESPFSEETDQLRDQVAKLEAMLQAGRATDADRQSLRELRSQLPQSMSSAVDQTLRTLAAKR